MLPKPILENGQEIQMVLKMEGKSSKYLMYNRAQWSDMSHFVDTIKVTKLMDFDFEFLMSNEFG